MAYCMFIFTIVSILILGTIIGSLLSVIMIRTEKNEKGIVLGRSHCPQCHHCLGLTELIPVVSYIGLNGKCKHCHKHVPFYYPLLELLTGLIFVLLFLKFPFVEGVNISLPLLVDFILYAAYACILLLISFSDFLFFEFSVVFLVVGACLATVIAVYTQHFFTAGMLLNLVFVAVIFGGQIVLSKGKWLGTGDFYLALIFAIVLPFPIIIYNVFFSYIAGAIVAVLLILTGRAQKNTKIPFAPFLAFGNLLVLLLPSTLFFLG